MSSMNYAMLVPVLGGAAGGVVECMMMSSLEVGLGAETLKCAAIGAVSSYAIAYLNSSVIKSAMLPDPNSSDALTSFGISALYGFVGSFGVNYLMEMSK